MSEKMYTILLAGYGWFAGIPQGETNNAELIARALEGRTITAERGGETVLGVVRSIVVPVVWADAFAQVEAAVGAIRPDVVIAIGTDARAGGLRPEPYGVNWQRGTDARPEAPDRQTAVDGPILPGGAAYLRGTLPYEAMVEEMLRCGVPAQLGALLPAKEDAPQDVSVTTGLYLCNKMTYLLAEMSSRSGLHAGFVHVPTQTAYAAAGRLRQLEAAAPEDREEILKRPIAGMELEMMIRGMEAGIRACLRAL